MSLVIALENGSEGRKYCRLRSKGSNLAVRFPEAQDTIHLNIVKILFDSAGPTNLDFFDSPVRFSVISAGPSEAGSPRDP
jgi:hypothetical protein